MTRVVGMVAGEPSGDLLAGSIIDGLHQYDRSSSYVGIGGPQMQKRGLESWHAMHALSVFGYVDACKRIPTLLNTYWDTRRRMLAQPPAVFVGVDAPDFNLRLERCLRQAGVPTVHFIGPSIWAWRYARIHKIRQAVSHMLVVFPFEVDIYRQEGIPVTYVGHPLASLIPLQPDRPGARKRLAAITAKAHGGGLATDARLLAILPGSRASEIRMLAPRFLAVAQRLQQRDPTLQCVVPMVNRERRADFERCLRQYPDVKVHIVTAEESLQKSAHAIPVTWTTLEAADAVLVAAGTATLEAALFKRPMVISYRLSPWMRRIMGWCSGQTRPYLPWVGLPNVLLRDFVVPELLQDEATPEKLTEATWQALTDKTHAAHLEARFTALHHTLLRDTPALAARAIHEVAYRG